MLPEAERASRSEPIHHRIRSARMIADNLVQPYILALALLALPGMLAACGKASGRVDIYEALNAICPVTATTCVIELWKITDFEWDRVVFVKMTAANSVVAARTGVKQIPREEFEDVILFLAGHQVVRVAKRRYHPEKPFSRSVFFDFSGTAERYLIFSRAEAVFKAWRVGIPPDNFLLANP